VRAFFSLGGGGGYPPHDAAVFFFDGAIDFIVFVDTLHRQIGRNLEHFEAVNIAEFFRFRRSRAGHARQLVVHAEVVLERDRGQSLVFRLDGHVFLGFQCLVQTFRIAAARHHAAGKFVDDDDLVIADDVVLIALEQLVGAERIVQMVNDRDILDVVEAFTLEVARSFQKLFNLLCTNFGEDGGLLLLVDFKIFRLKGWNEGVDEIVEIRTVFQRAGNDERRARLVDEDRVHFVDDGVIVRALHHLGALILHVVTQIVEAQLIVGAIGDVAGIGRAALIVVETVLDDADGQAEEVIEPAHGFSVAAGEVVVDRHHMHALALKRVEVDRQRCHQGLAFTGTHFGDAALVQNHAADQLHVERAHAEHTLRGLTRGRKSVGQNGVERFATSQRRAKFRGLGLQLLIGKIFVILLDSSNLIGPLAQDFHAAVVG